MRDGTGNLLQGDETMLTAKIHWIVLVPWFSIFLLGIILTQMVEIGFLVSGLMLIAAALIRGWDAIITYYTTELAVTPQRVVAKFGLNQRQIIEISHQYVESFNVSQSFFGKIFGFGTIIIKGTSGMRALVPSIANPFDFRRIAMEITGQNQTVNNPNVL